jgi:Family of unknown function (DUF6675)
VLTVCIPFADGRQSKAAQIAGDSATPVGTLSTLQKPQWPCDGVEPYPHFPALDAAPEVVLWTGAELGEPWQPPACTEWQTNSATKVVGLAGHFHGRRDVDTMLAQIGAVSSLRDVRYWSVTDNRWDALFVRVTALDGPDSRKPRGDFSAAEFRASRDLYFLGADNRSGEDTVWRLRLREAGERRVIVETTNVTPLRWLFLPLVAAGNIQTSYFLERETGDTWRLYSLTRVLYVLPLFDYLVPSASYINRAVAFYRHFAGIPPDRDPRPE